MLLLSLHAQQLFWSYYRVSDLFVTDALVVYWIFIDLTNILRSVSTSPARCVDSFSLLGFGTWSTSGNWSSWASASTLHHASAYIAELEERFHMLLAPLCLWRACMPVRACFQFPSSHSFAATGGGPRCCCWRLCLLCGCGWCSDSCLSSILSFALFCRGHQHGWTCPSSLFCLLISDLSEVCSFESFGCVLFSAPLYMSWLRQVHRRSVSVAAPLCGCSVLSPCLLFSKFGRGGGGPSSVYSSLTFDLLTAHFRHPSPKKKHVNDYFFWSRPPVRGERLFDPEP